MLTTEIEHRIGVNSEVPCKIRDAEHDELERQYRDYMARGGVVTVLPPDASNEQWSYNREGPLNSAKHRSQLWSTGGQKLTDAS